MAERVVVVGAGQAGLTAALSLRRNGFSGEIRIFGDEGELPYERPPLSKDFLAGGRSEERLLLKPAAALARSEILVESHARVESIDRRRRKVVVGGRAIAYDRLILATGARPRRLDVPGLEGGWPAYLRTLSDARALAARLGSARGLLVIGAGFLGLEVARTAADVGVEATVVESSMRLLPRSCSPEVAHTLAEIHRYAGLRLLLGAGVTSAEVGRLTLVDRTELAADALVVAIGAVPNAELAARANLPLERLGVAIGQNGETADPRVYAIGDVATVVTAAGTERHESVHNAVHRAERAAKCILGLPTGAVEAPWFWSQQGDLLLQSVGEATDAEETIFVRHSASSFTAYHFVAQRLSGVEAGNRTSDFVAARARLGRRFRRDEQRELALGVPLSAMVVEES